MKLTSYAWLMRRFSQALLVVCALIFSAVSPAHASTKVEVKRYSSCSQLRKVWSKGVATSVAKARRQPVRPAVNAAGYRKNRHLDTDRDGTACEVKKSSVQVQPPMTGPTTAPTTTTTTTTTTVPVRPTGIWKIRWMGVGGDAPKDSSGSALGGPGLNLVYGEQTEVVLCESLGEGPSTLSVKENGVWRKVADGFRTPSDSSRCADPARPIVFSFYWVVDSNGIARYRRNGRAYATRELEIQLRTSARVAPMLRLVGSYDGANWSDANDSLRCAFGETAYC